MVVPEGNCHFRGRPALSESPQPDRSTGAEVPLYSSIQSLDLEDEASISVMRTPLSLRACISRAAASAPSGVLG